MDFLGSSFSLISITNPNRFNLKKAINESSAVNVCTYCIYCTEYILNTLYTYISHSLEWVEVSFDACEWNIWSAIFVA